MTHYIKIFLFLILSVAFTEAGRAQRRPLVYNKPFVDDNQVEFKHYTMEDGLSNDRITDLLQDKHGYIWIATLNGLNKYDGKSFTVFNAETDSSYGVVSPVFTSLTQSETGDVYTGTEKGLFKYNPITNHLIKMRLKFDTIDYSNANVRNVLYHNDTLWIFIRKGFLFMYNLQNNSIDTSYYYRGTSQPYYYYHSLYFDKKDELWYSDRNIIPIRLNAERKKLTLYPSSTKNFNKKREADVSGFLEDSKGRFWVSGSDGVYLFDRNTTVFKKFIRPTTWCMAEDNNGIIWFGTGSGLLKYDTGKNLIISYQHQKDNPKSISSNNIYQILFDNNGNVWLATNKGIDIYSPSQYPFGKYSHIAAVDNSPAGHLVNAVVEGRDESLWIGYSDEGIDIFNIKNSTFKHLRHQAGKENSLGGDKIADLYRDSRGKIWIGLWQGIGFDIYDTKTKRFKLISYNNKNYKDDWYNDFIEADNGKMYIGFWGAKGLAEFDTGNNQFVKYFGTNIFSRGGSRLITRLEKDHKGNIWFGTTDSGVYRINPETDEGTGFYAEDSSGLSSNKIKDLLFSDGSMWVLNNRLQKFDNDKKVFLSFGQNIFSKYDLKAMLRDNNRNFWISTANNGLLLFDAEKNRLIAHYYKFDGLQSDKFSVARYKLSNGTLFFGGQKGFNLFDPKQIKSCNKLPNIFYGKFSVSGKVRFFETAGLKTIKLKPEDNTFTIDLLNTDMVNPEQYKYEVALKGLDPDWVTVSSKIRDIRYTAVPFGSYELRYRITDSRGNILTKPILLNIVISTPFYRTWIFYGLIFLIVIGIAGGFFKVHYDRLKTKQRNIELRERLFRLQVNPHFLFNSLISIQNYILNHKSKEAGMYLSNFARFFRIMLESSQTEAIILETEIEMLKLYLGLQQIRYPDRFDFRFKVDELLPEDITLVPAMMVQPVLENAIEHGFRNLNKKGVLIISYKKIDNYIRFEVEDNGIGLSASQKIKTPHKVKRHTSSALNIIKERANVLSEKYKFPMLFEIDEIVKNKNVVGTVVRINLPMIKNYS